MAVFKVYCDESRQVDSRYMLLGGCWILKEEGWNFVNEFDEYCKKELKFSAPLGHMKWTNLPTKTEGKYFLAYKYLIDLYFKYNEQNKMFFKTIIIDTTKFDFEHEFYFDGDYEKGFYSAYCQLLFYWISKKNKYHIRTASRNIKKADPLDNEEKRLNELKNKIHLKLKSKTGKDIKPIKSIEPRSAKDRRLIQITDILMGAVGFHWNDEHLKSNPKKTKLFFSNYIAEKLGKEDLRFETCWNEHKFNIFYLDISKSKK